MAGETKVYEGAVKTLEAAGLAIANNAIIQLTTIYDRPVDSLNYLDAEFAFGFTFAVAPVNNSTLDLYAAEQDIDGTNDETAPTVAYKPRYITSFVVTNIITIQYVKKRVRDIPKKAFFFLHNNATGQSVSAGWTGKITPFTRGPV